MKRTNQSGVIDPVTIIVIIVLGIGGSMLAGWKPLDLFRKKPDTVQLTKLQADLAASQAAEAKARADAVQLQKDKDAAILAERAKFTDMGRSGQSASEGAAYILGKIPMDKRSPESNLGTAMVVRANGRFAKTFGDLPKEQQDDITAMMDGVIQERDDALVKLAATDKAFTTLTGAHAITVAVLADTSTKLVVSNQKVEVLTKETGVVQGKVTVATNQVKVIAQTLSDEKSASSSLSSALTSWLYGALIVAAGFCALWLYKHIHSVGTDALGKVVADIRAGVDPIQALDTNINSNLHASIKQASLVVVATATPVPSVT